MALSLKVVGNAMSKMARPMAKMAKKMRHCKPEIVMGAGAIAVTAAFVWGIFEARKLNDIASESEAKVEEVKEKHEKIKTETPERYSEKEEKKEVRKAKMEGIGKTAATVAGPVITFTGGMFLILKGHSILRGMYAIQGVALKAADETLRYYRRNVIEEQGIEADQRYMHGDLEQTVKEVEVKENGETIETEKKVPKKSKNGPKGNSRYRIIFSEDYFDSWVPDSDRNIFFLKSMQESWDNKYQRDPYKEVSMYDILDDMRFKWETTDSEQRKFYRNMGWGHDRNGDGFITFNLYHPRNDAALRRKTDEVWMEFNCDGYLDTCENVYDKKYAR